MRIFKCIECKEDKKEIEFEYLFFHKKYESICKSCKENNVDIER